MAKNTYMRWRLPLVCLLWEVAMIILFGVFVRFGPEADAHWQEEKREMNLTSDIENDFYFRYPCEYLGSLVLVLPGPHPIHPVPTHCIPSHGRACQRRCLHRLLGSRALVLRLVWGTPKSKRKASCPSSALGALSAGYHDTNT